MARGVAVVLFTDLVGSTAIRGRVGEEAADELRRKHDQLLTQAVEANNGRVVKGLGDGIMATFAGASDGVAAAVAIQQAVDRLNRSGKTPVPLSVRVGLSAGDVSFEDEDAHGTPVIEAARLCATAAGGEILAAEVVRVLAGSTTEQSCVSVGPLELKGLVQPVAAVRVEWEPAVVSSIPMPQLLTDVGRVFVGREAELQRLTQLWKEAAAGERRVALLAGDPGVGKTRLAVELAARVHEEGGTVLAGRCDEDLGVPYQPFVEALRHFVDHTPAAELKDRLGRYGGELTRLVPELAEQVPDLQPPLQSDPETERYRLFDAIGAWLSAVSVEEPLLVVLDDLQWAAKPTLLLLRHVVRSSAARRLLILGTYRDTELTHDHALVELVADLRRASAVERLPLSGLDDVAVAAMVEQAAGQTLDDEGVTLARAIYQETEGNPFFVREVLRHLAETSAIEQRGGRWATRVPIDQVGIPEGVRDVVGRRLSRLSEKANQVLRAAAVVGAEFEADLVQTAGEFVERELLSALDEAIEARLVTEVSATRFRFAHALVRATLYESLTGPRRVALHRHVAKAIEVLHGEALDDYLPALAHHWAKASAPAADTAKAIDYARRAGDRALAQLAHDEAAAFYRQALDLLDAAPASIDEGQRLDLLISLGEAQRRAGDAGYRKTLLDAARMAQRQGNADALARAALASRRGPLWSSGGEVDDERLAVLETALSAIGDQDSPRRAQLLANLALELIYLGDRERRVRLSDEALATARRLGDAETLVHVLATRHYAIAGPGTLSERLADTEELMRLADDFGEPVMKTWARCLRSRAAMEVGDVDEVDRCLDVAHAITSELGEPALRWVVTVQRTGRSLVAGRLDDAERLALEAFQVGMATGQPEAQVFNVFHRYMLCFERGRLEEVVDDIAATARALPRLPMVWATFARASAELERPGPAGEAFEKLAATQFTSLGVDSTWLSGIVDCAAACAYLGDRTRAGLLFDLLAPHSDQIAIVALGVCSGAASYYLGLLATTLGRFGEAEHWFGAAATTHGRIAAPTWLAHTRLEWARMLVTRRKPGDADRARELLAQSLATARQLGLAKVERDAVVLLQ